MFVTEACLVLYLQALMCKAQVLLKHQTHVSADAANRIDLIKRMLVVSVVLDTA